MNRRVCSTTMTRTKLCGRRPISVRRRQRMVMRALDCDRLSVHRLLARLTAQQTAVKTSFSVVNRSTSKLHPAPDEHLNNGYSFGLPPTPRVPMGACFRFVVMIDSAFYTALLFPVLSSTGCPLRLHCSTRWVAPTTKDQHVLFGAEEGIYAINLNQLHESSMLQVHPRRCTWMYCVGDVLMAVQGAWV